MSVGCAHAFTELKSFPAGSTTLTVPEPRSDTNASAALQPFFCGANVTPPAALPTCTVATTFLCSTPINDTVSSPEFATAASVPVSSTSTKYGRLPTAIVATTSFLTASITDTVPLAAFTTYTSFRFGFAATPVGSPPTAICFNFLSATTSITDTVFDPVLVTYAYS